MDIYFLSEFFSINLAHISIRHQSSSAQPPFDLRNCDTFTLQFNPTAPLPTPILQTPDGPATAALLHLKAPDTIYRTAQ
jgi:hypothetical protein